MRHLIRFIALIVACGLQPAAVAARDREQTTRPCTAANSVQVTIDELWSEVRNLRGRCAAVEGYRVADAIFTDQRALYRSIAGRSAPTTGIVGIPYPGPPNRQSGLMRGTYYGRVENCRETQRNFARTLRRLRRQRDTDEIVLVHLYGFCAANTGPAVRVEFADEQPSSDLQRLTGDALRIRLGELVPIDDRYPYPAILAWLIDTATRGGCTRDFEPRAPPGGPPEGENASYSVPNLGPAQLAWLTGWCATAGRDRALFSVSENSRAHEPGTRLDVVICLCMTESCSERWPVSLIDTGWGVERPYFCQRARLGPRSTSYTERGEPVEYSDYAYDFADEWIVHSAWQDWGFSEPSGR